MENNYASILLASALRGHTLPNLVFCPKLNFRKNLRFLGNSYYYYFFLFCKFKNLMLFWMKISKIIFQFWSKNSNMSERKILSKLNFQTKIRFLDQCVPRQEEAELLSILNRKFWWTARASKWSTFSLHSTITMWYVVSIVKEIDSPRALHIV